MYSQNAFTQGEILSISDNQDDVSDKEYVLKSITFQGNKKTNSDYLLRELNLTKGEIYTYSDIQIEVKRLQRLNGLYDSEFDYKLDSLGAITLKVLLKEQRTLLPVVNFGLQENNRWFQIGVVDINLRGRGDELYAFYQNNVGRHAAQLYFRNNHVLSSKFGYQLNVLRWHSLEPLNFANDRLFYEYKNNLIGLGVHYRQSGMHFFEYSVARFNEIFEKSDISQDSEIGPDLLDLDKVLNKFEYNMNLLEYDQIYLKGSKLITRYQVVLTMQNSEVFNIFEVEYKHYFRPSNKTNIALRAEFGVANNNESPFSPFVLDSYQNIRGSGDRVLRGTALLTGNAEWRYTIQNGNKWSTQAVAFIDAGIIRTPGQKNEQVFETNNHKESIGIGGRIQYKKIYNAVLRLDYGYELNSKKGRFVVGLGQYF